MSWEQLQNKPKGSHLSIDGFYRTEERERELNSDMAAVFSTVIGEKGFGLFKIHYSRFRCW
jgi:hypothetical protein